MLKKLAWSVVMGASMCVHAIQAYQYPKPVSPNIMMFKRRIHDAGVEKTIEYNVSPFLSLFKHCAAQGLIPHDSYEEFQKDMTLQMWDLIEELGKGIRTKGDLDRYERRLSKVRIGSHVFTRSFKLDVPEIKKSK